MKQSIRQDIQQSVVYALCKIFHQYMLHQIYIKERTESWKLAGKLVDSSDVIGETFYKRDKVVETLNSRRIPSSKETSDELSLKNIDSNRVYNVITHWTSESVHREYSS